MERKKCSIFPSGITLKEIRSISEKHKEFHERIKGDLAIMGQLNTFPNPCEQSLDEDKAREYQCRREMRGLIFNNKTGELLCRPYHKFFNVNEFDETDEIEVAKNFCTSKWTLLEKLDGMFISGMMDTVVKPPVCRFVSKTGYLNKNSRKVQRFVSKGKIRYKEFVTQWCSNGYTPVFEFVEANRVRVVKYKDDKLILTALRNLQTGNYLGFEETKEAAKKFGIPCVEETKVVLKGEDKFSALIEYVKTRENIEGFCLRLASGEMFKMKTLFYVTKGKGNSDLSFQEHYIWRICLDNDLDDFKSTVAKKVLRNRISKFGEDLMKSLYKLDDEMKRLLEEFSKQNAQLHQFMKEKGLKGLKIKLFRILDGVKENEERFKKLLEFVKENSTSKKMNELSNLLGVRFY